MGFTIDSVKCMDILIGRCYMQDGPAYTHFSYTQNGNLLLYESNALPMEIPILMPRIYNNFGGSANDLRYPANSQNWQIV